MATIRKEIPVGLKPSDAWEVLCDYGALHDRLVPGFVTDTHLEGPDRVVTFANGAVARERLVALDADRHRLVYTVVESPLGFAHHQASVELVESVDEPDDCWLVWTTDLLPDELAPFVEGMMDEGAAVMARTLAA
jgi:Polyketide cyclase / dehydrase and lipid transport